MRRSASFIGRRASAPGPGRRSRRRTRRAHTSQRRSGKKDAVQRNVNDGPGACHAGRPPIRRGLERGPRHRVVIGPGASGARSAPSPLRPTFQSLARPIRDQTIRSARPGPLVLPVSVVRVVVVRAVPFFFVVVVTVTESGDRRR